MLEMSMSKNPVFNYSYILYMKENNLIKIIITSSRFVQSLIFWLEWNITKELSDIEITHYISMIITFENQTS